MASAELRQEVLRNLRQALRIQQRTMKASAPGDGRLFSRYILDQYRSNADETDEARIRALNERAVDFVKMHENIDLSLEYRALDGGEPDPAENPSYLNNLASRVGLQLPKGQTAQE